jgi:polyribonucleotide 5'-hydroxyl-kinase
LAPKSALPLGAARKVDELKAAKIDPTNANLLYSILAVSWAASEDQINDANVAGFIYVTAVDEAKKQFTALSMCPGKLPSPYLLKGSLKWIEK